MGSNVAQFLARLSQCCGARDGTALAELFKVEMGALAQDPGLSGFAVELARDGIAGATETVRAAPLPPVEGAASRLASWQPFVTAYLELLRSAAAEAETLGTSAHAEQVANAAQAAQFEAGTRARLDALGRLLDAYRDPFQAWQMPLLRRLVAAFVGLAHEIDLVRLWQRKTASKRADSVQKLAALVAGFAQDARPWPQTRRVALLFLINQAFRLFFRLRRLHLIQAFYDNATREALDHRPYPRSEKVTYLYFLGRWLLLEGRFQVAESYLSEAFGLCATRFAAHKQSLLVYLVVSRLVLGKALPAPALLARFGLLDQLGPLVAAYPAGQLGAFRAQLEAHRAFFRRRQVYLVLWERVQMFLWRNLLRRVYVLVAGSGAGNAVPLEALVAAARVAGVPEFSLDDAECLAVNLIHQSWIRAYIHHDRRLLVFSAKRPFSALYDVGAPAQGVWAQQARDRPPGWQARGSVHPLPYSELPSLPVQSALDVNAAPFVPRGFSLQV